MTEQVDLDVLIAEAREAHAVSDDDGWNHALNLAAALESTAAELRQERERADENERRWHASVKRANEIVTDKSDLAADLSRAEETIEKALERTERSSVYPLSGDIRGILKSYATQKEQA